MRSSDPVRCEDCATSARPRPLRGKLQRVVVIVLAATLAAPAAGRGEEPTLGEVTVRAERLPDETVVQDRTAFATVVDTSGKAAEADTVADVLAETVGVQVRRFGGLGAFSTLSIRGAGAGQVQIYLDGVPMSRARNEVVNLATLPLDGVDHIEVYRSAVPIGFSRSGPGGVVNIVTKSPGEKPRTALSASYGSFDSRKVDVERSERHGDWQYLVFGTYTGTAGNFTFLDDNGTPAAVNPFDDVEATRRNNGFNAVDLLSKVGYRISERATLGLTNQTFYKDEGVPGLGSSQARESSFDEFRNLTHLRGEFRGLGVDALDLRATGHVIYDRSQFRDREGEVGIGNQDNDNRTLALGADALLTYYWGAHQVPGLLLALGHEEFMPDDDIDPASAGPDQHRLRATVAAQDEVYLFGERLIIVPAVRWEWLRDDFSGQVPETMPALAQPRERTDTFTSPRLGVRLQLVAGLDLVGNIGRSFRPPNFGELFGDRGTLIGNPDLRSEEAKNRDLGFRFHRDNLGLLEELRLDYAYFANDFDDLIVLVPRSQGVLGPDNVGAARVRGHEVALSMRAWRHVALAANYTHQDAIDESREPFARGKRLPGSPQDEAYLRAEVYGGWARLAYEVSLIGDNFRSRGERERVPARDIHSLLLSMTPPRSGLTVTFEVKNLTDDQTADFAGFPLPGRSFFGTVQYTF